MARRTRVQAAKPILVVDDDPDIREALALILEEEGYRVCTAADGQEALELLPEAADPYVVLLDLMMPGLDGRGFLEQARRSCGDRLGAVVVMTAAGRPCRVPGALRVLSKPFSIDEVFSAVAEACAQPSLLPVPAQRPG